MRPRDLHSTYYRDRWSEQDLCRDFPGDEVLIDGLHAMQSHMWNNGVNIDIPVVQVMNTAHFLAAYMFTTSCSGNQLEYDAMAYMSLGYDRQLFKMTIIVLAAMLKRTEGFRARQCRNMLLENRDSDFEEGVTLYDRFLHSAEERFSEEDFLMDTQQKLLKLQTENQQLVNENIQLKYTITTMENQQNNQYNNCVIYNAPVYNTNNTNYYPQPAADPRTEDKVSVSPSAIPPDFFCISARFSEENIRERLAAELSYATTKIDYCRALYRLQHIGCINLNQYASDTQRANVFNRFQSKFNLTSSDFCKARAAR